ncbi:MAG: DUF4355 domain-containing protein [Peptococcaceae bacterium]|nr:DUF4355 domain-containing protein [Peptococcaceae bacterium]
MEVQAFMTLKDMEICLSIEDVKPNGKDVTQMNEDVKNETLEQPKDTETKETQEGQKESKEPNKEKPDEKKFTDADVNKIIEKRLARWQKEQQEAVDQAKKLADMTAAEKEAHRMAELESKLEEFERKNQQNEMIKAARARCAEKGINLSDGVLSVLVSTSAEETKENVDGFLKLFKDAVDSEVKAKLKGNTPKGGSAPPKMTKAQINAITDPVERQKMIAAHLDLYP